MTKYRGYQIVKETGTRDTWYNVVKNGEVLHRAAVEYAAMQWIDKELQKNA